MVRNYFPSLTSKKIYNETKIIIYEYLVNKISLNITYIFYLYMYKMFNIYLCLCNVWASLVAQMIKNLPGIQETLV